MSRLYQNTVLLVDDESTILDLLSVALESRIAKVYTAANGLEALNILRSKKIDLLISDIRMPKMDGIKLLEAIIQENIKVVPILFSGNGDYEIIKRAIQLGAHDYFEKPIDIELFSNRIFKTLDKINVEKLQNELLKSFLLQHSQYSAMDFDLLSDEEKETLLKAALGIFKLKVLNHKAS